MPKGLCSNVAYYAKRTCVINLLIPIPTPALMIEIIKAMNIIITATYSCSPPILSYQLSSRGRGFM